MCHHDCVLDVHAIALMNARKSSVVCQHRWSVYGMRHLLKESKAKGGKGSKKKREKGGKTKGTKSAKAKAKAKGAPKKGAPTEKTPPKRVRGKAPPAPSREDASVPEPKRLRKRAKGLKNADA